MSRGAASDVLLPVQRRYDLQIAETGVEGAPRWTVKDPISLKYFHLRTHEYFVFCQLDGTVTAEEIEQRFRKSHAPERLTVEHIQRFVLQLWNQGLITLDRFGTASSLFERSQSIQQRERTSWLTNVLAIRFRGVDPDQFLTAFAPYVRWAFSPVCMILAAILVLSAVSIAITEWGQLSRELPNFASLFSPDRILWFALMIAVTKVLHELGHGLACKVFGGECRELGVMFLVFTPCLYCNVSDAWLLKNRWHRILISGAGIYVELVLAGICTYLWWWSVPGLFHTLCLYVMVISSVNTVLLNGNPLLRYDGYYVLTDLVDIPNLRSRAQGLIQRWLHRLYYGVRLPRGPIARRSQTLFLAVYGVASSLYLWGIMFGILWMLYHAAKPYGLEVLVVGFGCVMIGRQAFAMIRGVSKSVQFHQQSGELPVPRFVLCSLLTVIAGYFLLATPITRRVQAPLLIEAANRRTIVTSSAGVISQPKPLRYGDIVGPDDMIGELTNLAEQRELAKLEGEVNRLSKRLELLQIQLTTETSAAAKISSVRSVLADYQARLEKRQAEQNRSQLVIDRERLLLPPRSSRPSNRTESQFNIEGDPLEARNQGAWMDAGTTLAETGDVQRRVAVLYVDQAEVALLKIGDSVTLITSQLSGSTLTGKITEIAAIPVETIPSPLAVLQVVEVQADENGQVRPTQPLHEVSVSIEDEELPLLVNQPGHGMVAVGSETVRQRLLRAVRHTFTFDL